MEIDHEFIQPDYHAGPAESLDRRGRAPVERTGERDSRPAGLFRQRAFLAVIAGRP
jgi:hypothetical protein